MRLVWLFALRPNIPILPCQYQGLWCTGSCRRENNSSCFIYFIGCVRQLDHCFTHTHTQRKLGVGGGGGGGVGGGGGGWGVGGGGGGGGGVGGWGGGGRGLPCSSVRPSARHSVYPPARPSAVGVLIWMMTRFFSSHFIFWYMYHRVNILDGIEYEHHNPKNMCVILWAFLASLNQFI